ncbi:hypothetical protein CAOG_08107 [Capsaspora owczarzaki ATCC 30864]|uniref:Uncharacterized protein n=1 Tax=Capsaspora owczarzaki (strain ATCC 30864) TaxID=595528 RepID=A0A0D2WXS3_CAPO3|nr:hypothetical protein CAOG_08107 [Capsaspora owczarzaki ATCC 30864]KJE98080.1 hypothetical protein CAOG_008107 [Capsaspora owczarzaki ATCC 30864]|eukprot:XP_004342708.1 hypothetical protein CAOG_08107 [Capsaspora owczarzaki ATCC 30864]
MELVKEALQPWLESIDLDMFEPANLLSLATTLPIFPMFFVAHCLSTAAAIRKSDPNARRFAVTSPIASILGYWLCCIGSGLAVDVVLGQPFKFLQNDYEFKAVLICWLCVFLSPFDLGYKLCHFAPVKILLTIGKEIRRARKVQDGVLAAGSTKYFVAPIVCGTLNGAGSSIFSVIDQALRGAPISVDLRAPELGTKAAFYSAVALTLGAHDIIPVRNFLPKWQPVETLAELVVVVVVAVGVLKVLASIAPLSALKLNERCARLSPDTLLFGLFCWFVTIADPAPADATAASSNPDTKTTTAAPAKANNPATPSKSAQTSTQTNPRSTEKQGKHSKTE